MAAVVYDGNGGLTIKRSTVEKAVLSAFAFMVAGFLTLFTWMGNQTYQTLRALHDGQMELNSNIKAVALQAADTAIKLEAHDRWAKEQKQILENRIGDVEHRRRRDPFEKER